MKLPGEEREIPTQWNVFEYCTLSRSDFLLSFYVISDPIKYGI